MVTRQPRQTDDFDTTSVSIEEALASSAAAIDDINFERVGLFQDLGTTRYLWMGLFTTFPGTGGAPATIRSAPRTAGISIGNHQYLPIEGLLEIILPSYRPRTANLQLRRDNEGPIVNAFSNRVMHLKEGALRLAWHEEYATHGGTYGLRAAASNRDLAIPFLYWERKPTAEDPNAGKLIMAFNAFVANLVETVTPYGIVVDCSIYPESDLFYPRRAGIGETALVADATNLPAPIRDFFERFR